MEDAHAITAVLVGTSLVLFVFFVAPIWIVMHYKYRSRQQLPQPPAPASYLSKEDATDLGAMAERMERRVAALEAIMDAEAPGWRTKS